MKNVFVVMQNLGTFEQSKSQKIKRFKKRKWKICLPVFGVSRKPSISSIINRKFPKFNCPLDYELQKQPPEAFYEK